MVVVIGVDVVVVLLVSHVLLIAQLAVETGVSLLLNKWKTRRKRVSIGNLTACIECLCSAVENYRTNYKIRGSSFSPMNKQINFNLDLMFLCIQKFLLSAAKRC